MNTIKTSKTTQSIIKHVFSQPQWPQAFACYQDAPLPLKDMATLHIIADGLVKSIPYGLDNKESESRYKGNLTRLMNDETVQAIMGQYPQYELVIAYDDTFAAQVFAEIGIKAV